MLNYQCYHEVQHVAFWRTGSTLQHPKLHYEVGVRHGKESDMQYVAERVGGALGGAVDLSIPHCDVSCCEGDLCNNPSGSPSGSPGTTKGPTSTSLGPTSSSVKTIGIPPNGALFGILALITVAFINLF